MENTKVAIRKTHFRLVVCIIIASILCIGAIAGGVFSVYCIIKTINGHNLIVYGLIGVCTGIVAGNLGFVMCHIGHNLADTYANLLNTHTNQKD